jgi:lysophospholipase L1-like esterase
MFGDSLGVSGGPVLAERLAARTQDALAMHNWSSQPTAPAADALALWAGTYGLPGRILMATGSNDIFNPPVMAAQIDRVMRIVGRTRTVVWVNVRVARPRTAAADRANSAWVNRQLAAATRRHSNLQLVHWAEFLDADPRRERRYLRDGVHTTPLGRDARNELIIRALVAAKVS